MSDIEQIAEIMRQAAVRLDTAFCISNPPHDGRFAESRDALKKAMEDLLAMAQWQPIETAPRDGTEVLIWSPRWKSARTAWTFGEDPFQCAPPSGAERTHWMPLPAPPKLSVPSPSSTAQATDCVAEGE